MLTFFHFQTIVVTFSCFICTVRLLCLPVATRSYKISTLLTIVRHYTNEQVDHKEQSANRLISTLTIGIVNKNWCRRQLCQSLPFCVVAVQFKLSAILVVLSCRRNEVICQGINMK